MGDTKPTFPPLEILESLVSIKVSNAEQIASLNGEFGDLSANFYEAFDDFDPSSWRTFFKVVKISRSNELKARERLRIERLALDAAEAYMDKHGHVGDIAEMGLRAAETGEPAGAEKPRDALSPDEARAAFEANADKAPTPAEVDAKAEKRAQSRRKKGGEAANDFQADLQATVAEGDRHIRKVAESRMPDIPPELDRRERAEVPDEADFGNFRVVS